MNHLACVEMTLNIIQAHGLTLGDFIMTVLDHEMPFSQSTIESLKHFIQGCTKRNHPINIIHALYSHPYTHPSHRYDPSYLLFPAFAIPLNDNQPVPEPDKKGNMHSELQGYFMDQTIGCTKLEMDRLLCDDYWCATNPETKKFD